MAGSLWPGEVGTDWGGGLWPAGSVQGALVGGQRIHLERAPVLSLEVVARAGSRVAAGQPAGAAGPSPGSTVFSALSSAGWWAGLSYRTKLLQAQKRALRGAGRAGQGEASWPARVGRGPGGAPGSSPGASVHIRRPCWGAWRALGTQGASVPELTSGGCVMVGAPEALPWGAGVGSGRGEPGAGSAAARPRRPAPHRGGAWLSACVWFEISATGPGLPRDLAVSSRDKHWKVGRASRAHKEPLVASWGNEGAICPEVWVRCGRREVEGMAPADLRALAGEGRGLGFQAVLLLCHRPGFESWFRPFYAV